MGKIAEKIKKIQVSEKLTLPEVFKKYPHLAELQHAELLEELELEEAKKEKQMKLLLG
jgi:hypothetical protein|tara:strand:+ start:337 stop:510 length:174 start_codon:yes stop_codon:yes gene_type:complete